MAPKDPKRIGFARTLPPPLPLHSMVSFGWVTLAGVLLTATTLIVGAANRIHHERPPNAEHLRLPPILLYSLQMSTFFATKQHIRLTLESMRLNPTVDFVIVSIVDDMKEMNEFQASLGSLGIRNIQLCVISTKGFVALLKSKLDIDHPLRTINETWARKLPEFKPIVAHLFREYLKPHHKYWGYFDMDLVWGNISYYAHWFQGEYPIVKTSHHCHGPVQFFANDDVFINMYVRPNAYVDTELYKRLLGETMYFNLDEIGKYTPDITNSHISVDAVMNKYIQTKNLRWNGGEGTESVYLTNVMIDNDKNTLGRHGPVVWQRGSLMLVASSSAYPAGREVMYYHRPSKELGLHNVRKRMWEDIIDDMLAYGYILPHWTPLLTRYLCKYRVLRMRGIHDYKPYSSRCFGQNTTDRVYIRNNEILNNAGNN